MDPSDPSDGFVFMSTAIPWFVGAVFVLALGGWVLTAVIIARNRRVLRQAGIDPTTAGAQLAVRYLRGGSTALPTGPGLASTSDRLAELTDLRDRGLITAEEYQARRAQIIAGI
ncbi:MAG TPA: SHOCT domain-containing protein [Jatrophihabitans sp.]|jgi:hypothetical protein|uniref:SHOCT domain-containing protein n=1 Tax=Jatrophihabitans sp. TaxID=1932789 RepID=UPI002F2103F3